MRLTTTSLRTALLGALGVVAAPAACGGDTLLPATNDSSSGGSTSSGGADSGSSSSGGGTAEVLGACSDPQHFPSGLTRCAEGYSHRPAPVTCDSEVPRSGEIELPEEVGGSAGGPGYVVSEDTCSKDSDCIEPRQYCTVIHLNPMDCHFEPNYARRCVTGCLTDDDCSENSVCVCGSPMGRCVPVSPIAGCKSDPDCEGDALCVLNARNDNFAGSRFACQLPGDECQSDQDCHEYNEFCGINETGRSCFPVAICGRPFLIAGQPRLAEARRGVGWLGGLGVLPNLPADPSLRERLARHWTEIALMEHASVAAFARFTLQLLELGAPAELIEESTRAQADEIRHARLACELASHYAGRSIAPGPLDLSGALASAAPTSLNGLEELLVNTVLEGCIGETHAALEVAHAAKLTQDAELRALLEAVAEDEARHAELAWRVVSWLVKRHPELAAVCTRELERAVLEAAAEGMAHAEQGDAALPAAAAAQGLLSERDRREIRARAFREVITPCARALQSANGDESPTATHRASRRAFASAPSS